MTSCTCCAKKADSSELTECSACREVVCAGDIAGGFCRSCVGALSRRTGRSLARSEIRALRRELPWARRGWAVSNGDRMHVFVESGPFSWRKRKSLGVLRLKNGDIESLLAERPIRRWKDLRRRVVDAASRMEL
jgi:hypothetical protein